MLGALDVIDAQAKADPEIAKFRRRGRVAHRSHLSQNDHTKRPGTCEFCRGEFSGRGIARHLRSCGERAEAVRVADEELAVSLAYLIHVRVESEGYWLELEVRASAPLRAVDEYLRDAWMNEDDCGHLSGFDVHAGFMYSWGDDDLVGDSFVGESLPVGSLAVHTFDYGSSTLSPNPPKDTDGRREDSGRGVRELQGR